MSDPAGLQFDHAEFEGRNAGGAQCDVCSKAISDEYYTFLGKVLCATCRGGHLEALTRARSGKAFMKAVLLGGATALASGVAYAGLVAVSDMQLALVTIGIAFVVAKVVRHASLGMSGRRFQFLAVVLTYFASALGYFPGVWADFQEVAAEDSSAQTRPAAAPNAAASSETPPLPPATEVAATNEPASAAPGTAPSNEPVSVPGFLFAVALLIGIVLAAPVLLIADAPIGFLIVVIGLWEAWKLSAPLPVAVEGPFRVAQQPALGTVVDVDIKPRGVDPPST